MSVCTVRNWLTIVCLSSLPVASGAEEPEAPTEDGVEDEAEITVEAILANPLDDDAYAKSSRCLSPARYRRIEIMNDRVIVFHGRNDDVWVNYLSKRCLGLRPDMILTVERHGMRLCARDRFRGTPRTRGGMGSMPCFLDDFHLVPADSVGAIRDAIQASERTTTVNRTVGSAEPAGPQDAASPEE